MLHQNELLAQAVHDLKEKIQQLERFYKGLQQSHAADNMKALNYKTHHSF